MLDGEVDKVSVYQDVVRWSKLSIMSEEQANLLFFKVTNTHIVEETDFLIPDQFRIIFATFVLFDVFRPIIHFKPCIIRVQHSFHLGEFTGFIGFAHFLILINYYFQYGN